MSVSVNALGELKAGSELRGGVGGSGIGEGKEKTAKEGTARVLTFTQRYKKQSGHFSNDALRMLYESGSSDQLAYSLNSSPGESDELPSFMFEI